MAKVQLKPESTVAAKESAAEAQGSGVSKPVRLSLKLSRRVNFLKEEQRRAFIAISLITVLSFIAFSNTFKNDFVFDDKFIIVANKLIQNLHDISTLFTSDYWYGPRLAKRLSTEKGSLYRPVVLVTYALNYASGGLKPFGYHLTNLLIHIVVTAVLYLLARKLNFSWNIALAASALFAVHPLHTEAVTGIVGRAELLMALGVLLSLFWYIKGGAPAQLRLGYALASWTAFAAALLSKEQAMMVPFLLILYDLSVRRGPGKWTEFVPRALFRYSGYFIILAAFLFLRAVVLGDALGVGSGKISFVDNPLAHVSTYSRLVTALKVAGKYLWLFFWPANLSLDYSYDAIPMSTSFWEWGVVGGSLACAGLLSLALWSYFFGSRRFFFLIGFAALTFLPASNLLVPIGTIMGERLFYLPSAGLLLALAAGWDKLLTEARWGGFRQLARPTGLAALSVILVAFTVRALLRNQDWRDDYKIFQSALRVAPRSAKMHYNFGAISGNTDVALKEYADAFRIYPDYPKVNPEVSGTFGSALLKKDRIDEAIEALERAAALGTEMPAFYYNLGYAYTKKGEWKKAEESYRKSLVLDLQDPAPSNSLSFVLWKQGRYEEALAAANEAIRLKPSFVEARFNRARALEGLGRIDEAIAEFERVLKLKPWASAEKELNKLRLRPGS